MTTATISFTVPTTRADGSTMPLGSLSQIQLWDGFNGTTPTMIATFGNPNSATLNLTTPQLKAGKHVFYVVAVDQDGNASDNSATVEVDVADPSPPTGISAQVNP